MIEYLISIPLTIGILVVIYNIISYYTNDDIASLVVSTMLLFNTIFLVGLMIGGYI